MELENQLSVRADTTAGQADGRPVDENNADETMAGGGEGETGEQNPTSNADVPTGVDNTGYLDPALVSPKFVAIESPANGADFATPFPVHLVPVGRTEREVDYVSLYVNGTKVFTDTKLPTDILLDPRAYPAGPLVLIARAEDGFESGGHAVLLQNKAVPMAILGATPRSRVVQNGNVVSIVVTVDAPAQLSLTGDFSALDSEWIEGSEMPYELGAGEWALTYIISDKNTRPDGLYTIPIRMQAANWICDYTQLQIALRNGPTNPVAVPGGIYVDERLPQPTVESPGAAPTVIVSNATILTGAGTSMAVDLDGFARPDELVGIIVGVENQLGYFQVPLDLHAPDALHMIDVGLQLRAYREGESAPSQLPVRIAVRDQRGRISAYASKHLNVQRVGSGDIQVSVSWDTETDVDLHVEGPDDCDTYYGNTDYCSNGGELDLDSNAGCNIDHVRNENVFWPEGSAPPGEYIVRVDFYEDCCTCGANYVATVNYCGKSEVYTGTFEPGTDDSGSAYDGRIIARFNNGGCQRFVRGRVRYEDRTFDRTGFGAYTWRTLEGAVVEIKRLQTNELLGTTTTDRNGNYAVPIANLDVPGFIVSVKAATDPTEGLRNIQVFDHPKFKRLYTIASPPVIMDDTKEDIVQDLDITVAQHAGAFNIFDTLRRAYDRVRLMAGRSLGELRAFWMTGTDTTDTLYCSHYLYLNAVCTEQGSVSVQGKEEDRDEYDDMVITKEFFKFALAQLSRDSHPGGAVDGTRDDATRAWTEGLTTFFAADVAGSRHFVNSRPFGVTIVDDLEQMPTPFASGTQGTDVSPHLVSAVLWDLLDPDDEVGDDILGGREGIYDVLFSYLPSSAYADRGVVGVDLTDFLDGWFCDNWQGQEGIKRLLDARGFTYAFDGPQGCENAP